MSEVALEPCPFCGGQAERVDIDDGENAGGSCIQCTQCLASGNVEFGYKENFVSNWNRRKAAASSRLAPGEIAKLVEWLQTYSVLLRRDGCADDADFHEEAAASLTRQTERVEELERRVAEYEALIGSPHVDEWFEAVRIEAAHQVDRWGSAHDAGKTPLDWFWLIGFLAQKAVHASQSGDAFKAKHHTISTGAALLNWFRRMNSDKSIDSIAARRARPALDEGRAPSGVASHQSRQEGEDDGG